MPAYVDRLIGVYHFLADTVPKDIPEAPPKPRASNRWQRDGKPIVARTAAGNDVRLAIHRVVALLGPLSAGISRGDRVLVKPNFNSADPYPASTDPTFLRAAVEMLLEAGAHVTIGESAGGVWRPTRNVFRQAGLYELARSLNVELIAFDDRPKDWVRVRIGGEYLDEVTVPRSVYEADRLVYLPCLKTHFLARYSGALKLAFGLVHPGQRRGFHLSHLEQKLPEVSLFRQPDLIIMDARKALVTGGPSSGTIVEPGLLFASGDLVAVDVEGLGVLLSYHAENRLPADPWQVPQIAGALNHRLGAGPNGYIVVQDSN